MAEALERTGPGMGRGGRLIVRVVALAAVVMTPSMEGTGQAPGDQKAAVATFKSSIALVRVSAVVRDHKGRFVQDLTARDFEILDGGQQRPITDFRHDFSGVSVAVLFDVSGSMEAGLANAREAAEHLLTWLEPERDEAAIFTFDTRLQERTPFTIGLNALPPSMST